MSTALILSLVAIAIALVAVAARRRGPSVTTIETRRDTDAKGE